MVSAEAGWSVLALTRTKDTSMPIVNSLYGDVVREFSLEELEQAAQFLVMCARRVR